MRLTLYLLGPIRLVCPERGEITPVGQKARAALALLGVAHGLRMSRTQVQDKLWSESSEQRGSASLRQTLREIRQSLGHLRDGLISGTGWIGLNPDIIKVDLTRPYQPGPGSAEFAADLDIRDPEFDDWIRDMRLRFEGRQPSASTDGMRPEISGTALTHEPLANTPSEAQSALLQIVVLPATALNSQALISANLLLQEACWRAAEMLPADMIQRDAGSAPVNNRAGPTLEVSAVATLQGNMVVILVSIRQAGVNRTATVRRFSWLAENELEQMPRAISQLTVELLSSAKPLAVKHSAISLWDVFEFSKDKLIATDKYLKELQEEQVLRAGTFMALRAYIRSTLVIERLVPDVNRAMEEAEEIATLARITSPGNASVLGISSLLMTLAGKADIAREFALLAEQADPHESFGRLAKSQALMDDGDGDAAYLNMKGMRASLLASIAPATWLMRRAMTEVRLGLFEQAELSTATAHAFAPSNHAALRYLGVLRAARGDDDGAAQSFAKLSILEPGFEPSMLVDPIYPAGSLRAAGLIKG